MDRKKRLKMEETRNRHAKPSEGRVRNQRLIDERTMVADFINEPWARPGGQPLILRTVPEITRLADWMSTQPWYDSMCVSGHTFRELIGELIKRFGNKAISKDNLRQHVLSLCIEAAGRFGK